MTRECVEGWANPHLLRVLRLDEQIAEERIAQMEVWLAQIERDR